MKTITEFNAFHLKNAAKTRQELSAAGKTAEELPAALGEALKLEGEKLSFLLAALETVGGRADDLKRVIVFTAAEGEKTPSKAQKKGEHWYLVEYYPPIAGAGGAKRHVGPQSDANRKGSRKGGKDKRRGGRGRPGPGERDGERPPEQREVRRINAPSPGKTIEKVVVSPTEKATGEDASPEKHRRRRRRRPPRAPQEPETPSPPPKPSADGFRVKPLIAQPALAGSAPSQTQEADQPLPPVSEKPSSSV